MKNLSVIIPAYNEEKIIEQTIQGLKKELNGLNLNYKIIVVNDGSTDKTKEILEKIKGIKLINHSENQGYGASLKTGIKNSKYDWILIIDADKTYPVEAISDLITHAPNHDMVVGARTGKKAKIPLIRKSAKWAINKLANYLSGIRIPDLNSGLRIIKRPLLEKFIFILPNGFSFTTTITLAALTNGHRVKYISIDYHKRIGKSKIRPIKDTLNFIQLIIRTVLYFNPLRVFMPIAFLLLSIGTVLLGYDILALQNISDKTIMIFLWGIQFGILGLLADMISHQR